MTAYLGDSFFREVQMQPLTHDHDGRELIVEPSGPDLLCVREAGVPVAYITRYTESESGILRAGGPMDILAPIFRTLEDALDSLRLARPV